MAFRSPSKTNSSLLNMPNNSQNLVNFFREAAPYIHMHRGKTFVIAISGKALQHPKANKMLSDIAILSTLGARIVLIHGARAQLDEQLSKKNHHAEIHNGIRITDKQTLEMSKSTVGAARLEIENTLNQALNRPPVVNSSLGIISGNFLTAKPIGVIDGIDYLYTGKVRKVNSELINSLLKQDNIVLVSPLGYSPTGQIYNVLYEEVAGQLTTTLQADKLIFIHDNKELSKLPRHSNLKDLDELLLIEQNLLLGKISQTMHEGIERVHLVDTATEGGILLELYTRDGIGSMLSTKLYDEPRQAKANDISGIMKLIKPLEAKGTLAKRTRTQLELEIDKFTVIERDGLIIGCAALYPAKKTETGELSCLAIHEHYRSGSRGIGLVEFISHKARLLGLKTIYVLTTQSIDWFHERGFKESHISDLPVERQNLYNQGRKSKILFLELDQ